MNILGIDPGKSGGIALLSDGMAQAWKMPDTERDLHDLIRSFNDDYMTDFAYIERVASMSGMGVVGAFAFGKGYGGLRMLLIALQIPFEAVAPGVWQRNLGCLSGGNKNVTKAKAQELYPQLKITHATADALLIATYGYRIKKGGGA